jgi:glucose 1-dehydrogenase/2-deoxy-D-gluconate 3-dehydrogenase
MSLENRVAIVTGAAQGIGAAIVDELVSAGARVIALDRQTSVPDVWLDRIAAGSILPIVGDVTSRDDVRDAITAGISQFGRLDIAVCNAGLFRTASFLEVDSETWDQHIAVNLSGVFITSQLAAREMVAAGKGGSIVVVTSISAEFPSKGTSPYVASKGGAKMLAEAMAWELGGYGIRVNCVAPGIVDTPLNAGYLADDEARRRIGLQVPLGRVATPGDIARVVGFLAGDEANYLTGVTVRSDGGRFLGWVP